eukprot:jgi/Bigna1/129673/aug1.9_g4381
MTETAGQMKTRHKLEARNLEKDFRARIKAAKGKDKKRELKQQQKDAEKEMKERHAKELKSHNSSSEVAQSEKQSTEAQGDSEDVKDLAQGVGDIQVAAKPAEKRLSKAQRRRLRKQAREEEQRKKYQEEAANMTDYKARENERLGQRLKPSGLTFSDVEADGSCLFRACEHQLQIAPVKEDEKGEIPSHSELRKRTAELLANNAQDYMPYLLKEDGALMSKEEYQKYCEKMGSTSAWGGQAEIAALSRLLGRQIIVHSAYADAIKMGVPSDLAPLQISFHQHYYSLGAHYNSVVPLDKE